VLFTLVFPGGGTVGVGMTTGWPNWTNPPVIPESFPVNAVTLPAVQAPTPASGVDSVPLNRHVAAAIGFVSVGANVSSIVIKRRRRCRYFRRRSLPKLRNRSCPLCRCR